MIVKRVGILRGGGGENYETSLREGGEIIFYILENLSERWKPADILIDKNNLWHLNGLPIEPSGLIHKVDVVWNVAHPSFSIILSNFSIPEIGSSFFSSTMENNREILEEHLKDFGMKMPRRIVLPLYQKDFDGPRERYAIKKAREVFEKFSAPWIVKSYIEDGTMGVHVANTFDELVGSIEDGVKHEKSILVEELIIGKVASVHSVPGFRGEDIYTFPFENSFGNFSFAEKEKLISLAKDLHNHVGAKHYLKSDFVLSPKGKVSLLNIDSTPDLRQNSHFYQACGSAGVKTHNVIEHILEQAF